MALEAALSAVTAADATFSVAGAAAWLTVKDRTATLTGVATAAQGGTGISALGTGVATALGVNVGSAGAFVTFNGALGTPSSGTATNLSGTAAGLTAGAASAVALGGITGLGTNIATALAVNVGTAGAPVINGGALGTPSSGTATNLSGTAASLTAGTVTTNANLTGPVTSTGNATAIAAGAIALSKLASGFTSTAQTISQAGGLTLAHGLGAVPTLISMRIKCTSTNLNYAENDEVFVTSAGNATDGQGVAVWPDATNVNVRFANVASVFAIANKTSGTISNIDVTKWTLIVRAWVLP